MDSFKITNIAVTRLGAACLGARSQWAEVLVGTGVDYALGLHPVLAAGTPDARYAAAFRPAPAQTAQQIAQQTETFEAPQTAALVAAASLPMSVHVTRKPTNVHKTRINGGGYGAMGPHPERERLAS